MRISLPLTAWPMVVLFTLFGPIGRAENVRGEWTLARNEAERMQDQAHGFDFLMGRWHIHNRRLVKRLQGSTEWQEFESQSVCNPLPVGIGNQDEYRTEFWKDFVGLSFRFFDPSARQWSIYWIDSRTRVLQPPVVGRFAGDVGIFEGPDQFEGRPILVRYTWSRVTTTSPRWEQAFSADGGKSWETNWTMDFSR